MRRFRWVSRVLAGMLTLGSAVAYDFEYDAGDIEGTKTSTGITYTLSVSKGNLGTSYDFDTKAGATSGSPSGIDISVSSGGATGTKEYSNDALPTANFTISMNGKLIPPSGGTGPQPTWGASGNAKAPFYIKSDQDGGAKNIVVPHGASMLYTAYSGTSTQESTWNVTNFPSKDSDSIRFNKSWWLSLWPWSAPNITDPVPGVYSINATSKGSAGSSDSGEMKVVGVASMNGHGKTSTRAEPPSGIDKWTDSETIYAQPKSVIELTMTLNPNVTLDDTLKNSITWSVSGIFSTITPKESNKLEATLTPGSSGDYVVTASCGSSQRLIRVKVSAPKIHSVTFNSNITINKDTGGSYSGVAWKDDDLDGGSDLTNANADSSKKYHPIAYRSTSTISASAVFKPNCLKSNPANDKDFITAYDVEAAVKKVRFTPYSFWSWGNDWSTPIALNMGGTSVTAASAFNSSAKVGYDGGFELAWEVGFGEAGTADGSLSWQRSYSKHELYLTYNAATSSYETVFHVGCTNANGKTSESQIVSSIWSEFTDCSVKKKGESATLKYYGAGYQTGGIFTTQALLNAGDGRCGSWANFLGDIITIHGISAVQRGIFPASTVDGFLVKNWTFKTVSPTPPNIGFPYFLHLVGPESTGTFPGTGINGQGPNTRPQSIFSDHAVVQYGSNIYDPSYGTSYASGAFESNFKSNALDGFFVDISGDIWATNDKSTSISLR